ncbi:MAG: NifB/NifX family molybdenum-iron cluster-binding protein [Candidatus Hermodarchaeota archaeon]
MVIVAVPSVGEGGLKQMMNSQFGRCDSFTFVTIENNEVSAVKTVPNSAVNAMGGAGIQAAQTIANNGATDIIVGFLGPNAAQSLGALNLNMYQINNPNQQYTVKDVIDLYIQGKLQKLDKANVGAHYGMEPGIGGGRGMGRGGGMGGGRRQF